MCVCVCSDLLHCHRTAARRSTYKDVSTFCLRRGIVGKKSNGWLDQYIPLVTEICKFSDRSSKVRELLYFFSELNEVRVKK